MNARDARGATCRDCACDMADHNAPTWGGGCTRCGECEAWAPLSDVDLPGMWEAADLEGGSTDGCDCAELCEMGPTCPGGMLAGLTGSGCWRSDLAPLLRDWRMSECEHRTEMDVEPCCSPCLRDRLLASDWLAEVKRNERVAALREAANEVGDECRGSTETCFCGSARWLRERAAEYRNTPGKHDGEGGA